MQTIIAAAVQFAAEPGAVERNLAVAATLVSQAAAQGAQLILLPELTPGGYLLTEAIWDGAEAAHGRSQQWLSELACRYHAYVGMSYLEAEGEHFYNTFALMGPDGNLCGTVRKDPPASAEAFFFAAGCGSHCIETPLGRIGVCICYEAILAERLRGVYDERIDLLLVPMSAGTPEPMFPIRSADCATYEAMLRGLASHHAQALGVPVVMANKCGPLVTAMPGILPDQHTYFPGLSTIADADGTVRAQLGGAQGVAVGEVTLDARRKSATPPRRHGHWALPVPWFSFLFPLGAFFGKRAYARSRQRAARARQASGG